MPNRLARAVSDVAAKAIFRQAEVEAVTELSPTTRQVELAGRGLRGVRWNPGDKAQVRIEGFTNRTYTPSAWDPKQGTVTILVSTLGRGPGHTWAAELRAGDSVQLFGPRASVDLRRIEGRTLIVGDETCYGLALASCSTLGQQASYCFEAQAPVEAEELLVAVGISACVVPSEPLAVPLASAVTECLTRDPDVTIVLAGRAQSIRQIREAIRDANVHSGPALVKSYWDENRAGLD